MIYLTEAINSTINMKLSASCLELYYLRSSVSVPIDLNSPDAFAGEYIATSRGRNIVSYSRVCLSRDRISIVYAIVCWAVVSSVVSIHAITIIELHEHYAA